MDIDKLVSNTLTLKTELTDVRFAVDEQAVRDLTLRLFELAHGYNPNNDDDLLQEAHRRGYKLAPIKAIW